jgi:hypothetical protein
MNFATASQMLSIGCKSIKIEIYFLINTKQLSDRRLWRRDLFVLLKEFRRRRGVKLRRAPQR